MEKALIVPNITGMFAKFRLVALNYTISCVRANGHLTTPFVRSVILIECTILGWVVYILSEVYSYVSSRLVAKYDAFWSCICFGIICFH